MLIDAPFHLYSLTIDCRVPLLKGSALSESCAHIIYWDRCVITISFRYLYNYIDHAHSIILFSDLS